MANEIIAWRYTSDNGTFMSIGVNRELSAQDNGGTPAVPLIGGQALAANHSYPPVPDLRTCRKVLVRDSTGYERLLILMENTAPLATLGTSVAVEDSDGASHTCLSVKVISEHFRLRSKT